MKKEEGFSMQKGSSSGSYCLLGTELSKILLTPNSSETYSRCCLNIKEGDFELGFSISSFTFWAVKHNQISQLLNISEGIVIWLLLKIQTVILEKLPPSDSHIIFCSQWRRSEFKLPLTWSKSTQMLEIGNTAISPQRAIHLLSAQKTWLFLVRTYLNHCFSKFYAGSLTSSFTSWFLYGLSTLFHFWVH